ncbi:MAG: 50S ribosomal protein L15 [candidate division CPR2 bacterium GW2011_GWC1_39_9]|nr:MAG: 50S ribosomal protein L15 [candidate division CPR2 bacterium GW2011_GWC1_39_9]
MKLHEITQKVGKKSKRIGQTPLIRRIPKLKGFKSRNPKAKVINLDDLNKLSDGAKINDGTLVASGLILKGQKYKILNSGNLEKKLTLDTESVSKEAKKIIDKSTKEAKKAS